MAEIPDYSVEKFVTIQTITSWLGWGVFHTQWGDGSIFWRGGFLSGWPAFVDFATIRQCSSWSASAESVVRFPVLFSGIRKVLSGSVERHTDRLDIHFLPVDSDRRIDPWCSAS